MDPQRRYALFELKTQLPPSEPYVHEFIIGIDAIAKAAGYSLDYFRRRYFDVPASRQTVESGLPGYHTGLGHFYLYRGGPATHPSSAAAWGRNARELAKRGKQARAPGWYGSRTCSVSAGSVQSDLHIAEPPALPILDFKVWSWSVAEGKVTPNPGRKPGSDHAAGLVSAGCPRQPVTVRKAGNSRFQCSSK